MDLFFGHLINPTSNKNNINTLNKCKNNERELRRHQREINNIILQCKKKETVLKKKLKEVMKNTNNHNEVDDICKMMARNRKRIERLKKDEKNIYNDIDMIESQILNIKRNNCLRASTRIMKRSHSSHEIKKSVNLAREYSMIKERSKLLQEEMTDIMDDDDDDDDDNYQLDENLKKIVDSIKDEVALELHDELPQLEEKDDIELRNRLITLKNMPNQ